MPPAISTARPIWRHLHCGTVFELTPTQGGGWTEKVLHNFNSNGADGCYPDAGLIFDAAGNLYGTTYMAALTAHGTVFELTPNGGRGLDGDRCCIASAHGTDGSIPYASLIFDTAGNLYGTTQRGGILQAAGRCSS